MLVPGMHDVVVVAVVGWLVKVVDTGLLFTGIFDDVEVLSNVVLLDMWLRLILLLVSVNVVIIYVIVIIYVDLVVVIVLALYVIEILRQVHAIVHAIDITIRR